MTPDQLTLLRRTITRNLSADEHALFVLACERSGLDPFARHIYPLRKRDGLVIEATIDGLRLSAERTGEYAGQLGPEWCGPDGVWLDIWTAAGPPNAARVGIKRKGFTDPIWGKALYSEFVQGGEFWEGMPALMLAKCAEALGFRKAFPREFFGLYTPEEVPGTLGMQPSECKPLRVTAIASVDDPERGGGVLCSAVPAPLQPFFEAGLTNRRNLQAAYGFIQKELDHLLGEAGTPAFRRIYSKHMGHGLFTSREKCEAANRACLLELWATVEGRRVAA